MFLSIKTFTTSGNQLMQRKLKKYFSLISRIVKNTICIKLHLTFLTSQQVIDNDCTCTLHAIMAIVLSLWNKNPCQI